MLRGNHETRSMTQAFDFYSQCIDMYDQEFYETVMDTFDCLPLAAVINGEQLCMHGGIS